MLYLTRARHELTLLSQPDAVASSAMKDSLPVVFIHSLTGRPAQWAPQVEHLEARRQVVAVTLPGHAGRPAPDEYTVEALAAGVAHQVEGLERFVLVGHSTGAIIAIHLAAAHPDRVAGLVLVDPGTDARQFSAEQAEPMLAALRSDAYAQVAEGYWREILQGATDATREQALADLRAAPSAALPGFLSSLGRYDAVTPLREYAASHPVLALTPPASEGPQALFTPADGVEQEHVEGTSHWVQLDKPEFVNEALDRFLDRLE